MQLVERSVEAHGIVPQETVHDLELLGEPPRAIARRREVESVRLVLPLHPAGADAERDPAAGDLVRGRRLAREDGGMAKRDR